ncbi:MAG: penicillin-binding transpeptidase domain-containing protein [Telluria sp.]
MRKIFSKILIATGTSCAVALIAGCSTPVPIAATPATWEQRSDFGAYFDEANTPGTLLIRDVKKNVTFVHNPMRARQGYVPASTFKILNSLIGLDTGVVKDVDQQKFRFSGVPFEVRGKPFLPPQCNKDVTLRTAFKFSCIPVYQELAKHVGMERYKAVLNNLEYGTGELGAERLEWFWLEGAYQVSAQQQVDLLVRLYRGELPFSARSMELVRDMMVVEKAPTYTLRAKTGYLFSTQPEIGWYVGWLEKGDQAYVFALNLDMSKPEDARARATIVKSALKSLGVL